MEYKLEDELDWIAWIASNGTITHSGAIKTKEQIDEYGLPKQRTAIERIDFLYKYLDSINSRALPEGWSEQDRMWVIDYVINETMPFLKNLRNLQLGDVV